MSDVRPAREIAIAVLATNPLVRAAVLADLRAQVEALPGWDGAAVYVFRDDVLALIDGSSDE